MKKCENPTEEMVLEIHRKVILWLGTELRSMSIKLKNSSQSINQKVKMI